MSVEVEAAAQLGGRVEATVVADEPLVDERLESALVCGVELVSVPPVFADDLEQDPGVLGAAPDGPPPEAPADSQDAPAEEG